MRRHARQYGGDDWVMVRRADIVDAQDRGLAQGIVIGAVAAFVVMCLL